MSNQERSAGQHLLSLLQSNREFRAGAERGLLKLRAFSSAVDRIGTGEVAPGDEYQAEINRLYAKYHNEVQRMESHWEAEFGAPYPRSIEEWMRWAARVGWSGERVVQGEWTPRDLFPIIEGYLLRLRDQHPSGAAPAARVATGAARALELVMGCEQGEILKLATSDATVDDKLRAICGIDRKYLAWNSPQLAELLGVTAAAIRRTHFWRVDRPAAIEAIRD